ncbi:hypothetical protein HNR23_000663 [Nocardiopsis mwathae]|uniref:Uncharacterized protein n=1 Tax=Nocardiopsis mwathae TaxID=1472723 RepID=A0A7W9YEB2_9ACTN|nr:hypothetical protein [Nocardiopsis mwathae]MBB6170603.1 hypothetical protein [Nocardiopsis mwathae]
MTSPVSRVVHGFITVTYDPRLPFLQRFTIRERGGRIVRLRAPRGEAHRALVRECGLSRSAAARILNRLDGGQVHW